MKLSVIIVAYKHIQILRDCLDSIAKYNDIGKDLEVIVVDNSPTTELFDAVKSEYDWITLIHNDNKGFGEGNNRGYELSKGEYLLFLNPDTVLVEPLFDFAVTQFEKDKDLALFGVQLRQKNMKKTFSFYSMDRYGIRVGLFSKFCRAMGWYQDGKMFICGADMFVRRNAFAEAGMFDENIFMYHEEADLIRGIKSRATAKRTAFFKQKSIIHLEGGTQNECIDQAETKLKRMLATDLYYAKKWGLDVEKMRAGMCRYEKLKLFLYRLIWNKRGIAMQKRLIAIYKDYKGR